MALYSPIIDSSNNIQKLTISGNNATIAIKFTTFGENPETANSNRNCLVRAIDPRSGTTVFSNNKTVVRCTYSKSIYFGQSIFSFTLPVPKNTKNAQISVAFVDTSVGLNDAAIEDYEQWYNNNRNSVSGWSSAVVFTLLDIVPTVTWNGYGSSILCPITTMPFEVNATVAYANSAGTTIGTETLEWYDIAIEDDEGNIVLQTERKYQTSNTIKEIVEYDFSFRKAARYTVLISGCTSSGLIFSSTKDFVVAAGTLYNGTDSMTGYADINVTYEASNATAITKFTATPPTMASGWELNSTSASALYKTSTGAWAALSPAATVSADYKTVTFSASPTNADRVYQVIYGLTYKHKTNNTYQYYYVYSGAFSIAFPQEHIILKDKYDTVQVKYNPELGQLKYNISDVVTPTLGSKYPFIYRNGMQNYRTFTIGGLITCINGEELEDNEIRFYGNGAEHIQERIYREKILDFLYRDTVKSFTSIQEGKMLIRLTGVSLTPMKQLGRMLYSFSATAIEVAEYTSTNLTAYEIEG